MSAMKNKGNIELCAKELAGVAGAKSTLHLTEKRLYNERCLVYSRDAWCVQEMPGIEEL